MIRRSREEGYLPTREEIRGACRRIRAGWTEPERIRRSAWLEPPAWKVPTINLPPGMQGEARDE